MSDDRSKYLVLIGKKEISPYITAARRCSDDHGGCVIRCSLYNAGKIGIIIDAFGIDLTKVKLLKTTWGLMLQAVIGNVPEPDTIEFKKREEERVSQPNKTGKKVAKKDK